MSTAGDERKETSGDSGIDRGRRLRCIVKLGGAAVTCKGEVEKINDEALREVSSHLREALMGYRSETEVLSMDWSRRSGAAEMDQIEEFDGYSIPNMENFIIVHGAGSFGHFQASKSGVHKGHLHLPIVKAGFVATRISVTSLCLAIVRALAREGMPAIGMPPFASGWETTDRNVASAHLLPITRALESGLIPVLHGDAVLDNIRGCTILSGDVIIRHLAENLMPDYVVFLTDVLGVYDRPPADPHAVLLREIEVGDDGRWHVLRPLDQGWVATRSKSSKGGAGGPFGRRLAGDRHQAFELRLTIRQVRLDY
ncbi:amino acid kinase family protein isoform X2 [Wolffia australiana]